MIWVAALAAVLYLLYRILGPIVDRAPMYCPACGAIVVYDHVCRSCGWVLDDVLTGNVASENPTQTLGRDAVAFTISGVAGRGRVIASTLDERPKVLIKRSDHSTFWWDARSCLYNKRKGQPRA
jgi:hypothetical protein